MKKTLTQETSVTCDQCGKPFRNDMALRVHKFRAHTAAGKRTTQKIIAANRIARSQPIIQKQSIIRKQTKRRKWGDYRNIKDNEALLISIANNKKYVGSNGNIAWKRAMIEHPEWAEKVGYSGVTNQLSYWYKLYKLRQKTTGREQRRVSQNSFIPNTSSPIAEVNFCPKCGEPLKLNQATSEIIKRMQNNGLDEERIIAAFTAAADAIERI